MMVEYGGVLGRTSGLSEKQHAYSILIGSSSLFVSYLIKKLPESISRFLDFGFKDNNIHIEDNRFMSVLDKVQNTQASDI